MSEHREFCHNCGVAISEPSAFCSSCGAALTQPAASPAAATATASAPPAANPPGDVPPEAPPGAVPPGAVPPGAVPPGATAEDGAGSSLPRWIPFAVVGGAAFVVVAAAVALLLTLGGSAGNNVRSAAATRRQALALLAANGTTTVSRAAPGLYAFVTADKLNVAAPAGWRATAQTAGSVTRAEFADPSHAGSSLTVVAEKVHGGNPHARAISARKAVAAKGGSVASLTSIAFPGGRQAWRLTYSAANVTHDTYFFAACNGSVAMVVDAAASPVAMQQQQTGLEAAAAGTEPQC